MGNVRTSRRRRTSKVGAPPGTLLVDPQAPASVVTAYGYDGTRLAEEKLSDLDALAAWRQTWPLVWVNVDGLGSGEVLAAIAKHFALHPLSLEDVVNVNQRPKVETYEHYLFVVLRMVTPGSAAALDQMSLFVGQNFVVTFQEQAGDCFDPVRERLRKHTAKFSACHADYLAYALIDALIDHYFPHIEHYGERLDALQDEVLLAPTQQTVQAIVQLKHDLLTMRRAIWPLRDELSALARDESIIRPDTRLYLRDCYDHTIVLIDMLESQREIAGSLMDIYLSSVSNRMNEVMKVLTIIATIFIPLTFIAGIYGMNFNPAASPWNMPELNATWGYPLCLLSMVLTALGFVGFIWRRGWFKPTVAPVPPPRRAP